MERGVDGRSPIQIRRIEEMVDQYWDQPASRHGGRILTYGDMEQRANGIAHRLLDAGISVGDRVLISGAHDPDTVVAMVGVLKAGGALVVLDSGDPQARRQVIADRSDAAAIVETGAPGCDTGWLSLDVPRLSMPDIEPSEERPAIEIGPDDLVWVLYTSGSTGHPKGVPGTNESVVRPAVKKAVEQIPGDTRLVLGRLCWLAGVGDVLGGWAHGQILEFHDVVANGTNGLADRIRQLGLRRMGMVPTLARSLFGSLPTGDVLDLERMAFYGEQLWWSDLRMVAAHVPPECIFVNSLASSETGGICRIEIRAGEVGDDEGPVPVGPVRDHWRHRIVDAEGVDVEPGTAGQLVVATDSLFPGYFNDAELNARRWTVDDDGTRWFATGDMVVERPDGMLQHAGRADFQLKINGVLVAPEEAESLLAGTDGVVEAAVVGASDRNRRHRLVAHIVVEPEGPGRDQLEAHAREQLPAALVPADIRVGRDPLPRLANGKVNRSLLTERSARPLPGRGGPAQSPVERAILGIMSDVLELTDLGRDDDFWSLGGDSLGAVELIAQIEEQLGVRLPLMAVAESPSAAQLAQRLDAGDTSSDVVELTDRHADGSPLVMIPGAGGTALRFTSIAAALEDRPVLVIEHAGSRRRGFPSRTVEAAARRAVKLIDADVLARPFALLGYSYGSYVAYEAARLLDQQGHRPSTVIILDASASVRRIGDEDPDPVIVDAVSRGGFVRTALRRSPALRRVVFWGRAQLAGLDRPGTRQHHKRLFLLAGRALRRHRPQPYAGHVTVIRNDSWPEGDPTIGWGAVAAEVDAVQIDGDHQALPLMPAVADAIRVAMDGAVVRERHSVEA